MSGLWRLNAPKTLYWSMKSISDSSSDFVAHTCSTKLPDLLAQGLSVIIPQEYRCYLNNINYLRAIGLAWPDAAIVQQPAAQLSHGLSNNCLGWNNLALPSIEQIERELARDDTFTEDDSQ